MRRLLTRASQDAAELLGADRDELRRLLDRITAFAALAIEYDREPWLRRAVAALERIYELGFDERGFDRTEPAVVWLWLDIVTRVHALGALAVRHEAWPAVKLLASTASASSTSTAPWWSSAKAARIKSGNFYTNFARYYSTRSAPAFETMVTNHPIRDQLFDGDDHLLADATRELIRMANKEGSNYNGWDGLESPVVDEFIHAHGTREP